MLDQQKATEPKKGFESEIKFQDACSHFYQQLDGRSARLNSSSDDDEAEERILTSQFSKRVFRQVALIFYSR